MGKLSGAEEFPELPGRKPDISQALELLGLGNEDRDNSEAVRSAYRRLSLRYHPDKNQGKEEQAKQAFTAITAAYHVLSTANFDFERWKENFTVPPMQSLNDVLQLAFDGKDPLEIEQMLRARGDYRPHPEFGTNVHIPWSAGTRETPKFDSMGTAYTKTETLGYGESRVDDSAGKEVAITDTPYDESQLVGKSMDRPWENVGSVGTGGLKGAKRVEKYPHLSSSSEGAAEAAETMNGQGVELQRTQDIRAAWECYNEAVRLAPDKAVYRANRAAAGIKRGRYRDVIADCNHALRLEPSYVKALVCKGQAHAGRDTKVDYQEAKKALERALEIEPSNKVASKALKDVEIALEAEDSDDD